jgi:phenylalanyl-tRNA synthetase beta chain
MLCSGKELGLTEADYPGAEVNGILILRESYPLGMDIREAIGIGDVVLEAEPTPNRPDCMSVIGIAREVAAAIDRPLRLPDVTVKEKAEGSIADHVQVDVIDGDLCPRYMARTVKILSLNPRPSGCRTV